MTAIIIIAAVIAVFAVLFSVPVSCGIYFRYDHGIEQDIVFKYGFIRLRLPGRKEKTKKTEPEKPAKSEAKKKRGGPAPKLLITFARENKTRIKETVYAVLGYIFKRLIKINRLKIKLVLGLDDAMDTALVYGAAAGFIFNVLGVMDRKMRLGKHTTEIKPAFNDPHIFAEIEAKISTSIGRVLMLGIIGAWHILPLMIRLRKSIREEQ